MKNTRSTRALIRAIENLGREDETTADKIFLMLHEKATDENINRMLHKFLREKPSTIEELRTWAFLTKNICFHISHKRNMGTWVSRLTKAVMQMALNFGDVNNNIYQHLFLGYLREYAECNPKKFGITRVTIYAFLWGDSREWFIRRINQGSFQSRDSYDEWLDRNPKPDINPFKKRSIISK